LRRKNTSRSQEKRWGRTRLLINRRPIVESKKKIIPFQSPRKAWRKGGAYDSDTKGRGGILTNGAPKCEKEETLNVPHVIEKARGRVWVSDGGGSEKKNMGNQGVDFRRTG